MVHLYKKKRENHWNFIRCIYLARNVIDSMENHLPSDIINRGYISFVAPKLME